jgi:hypothetical protein
MQGRMLSASPDSPVLWGISYMRKGDMGTVVGVRYVMKGDTL